MPVLHQESIGQGPKLILLHGWGMHGGLFQPLAESLAGHFECILVDLPGHGRSVPFDGFADIDRLTDYLREQLAEHLSQPVYLLGWSTGALLAQRMAMRYSQMISKLILVTGTPCFTQRDDWAYAVEVAILQKFAADLLVNFDKTLQRFLALQFMHSDDQKEQLRRTRELLTLRPTPDADSLSAGLQLLSQTDLRDGLNEISCPVLILNGERDSLIPSTAARYLAEQLPDARSVILRGSGHAPFLSHSSLFIQHLESFLS